MALFYIGIMDKPFFCKAFAVLLFLLVMQSFVSAAVEDAVCNDYYTYAGLKFDELSPDKAGYVQGENVTLTYAITNKFGSPLVRGDFWPVVMYWGPDLSDRADDGDVVESPIYGQSGEFSIQKGDTYSGSFSWKIPKNAKPGYYVVNVYFVVDRKFDISGLSFMTSVPAKKTSFKVIGNNPAAPILDKSSTYLNGVKYGFREPIPEINENAQTDIKTKLINPDDQPVTVYYELFSWNTLDRSNGGLNYQKVESVNDSRDLIYDVRDLPVGVYVAKISARSGDWVSVEYVRFYVKGSKAGFVWAGLDHFPLMKGDTSTLSFCFTNLASQPGDPNVKTQAKIVVSVSDDSGNKIVDETYQAKDIVASIQGKKVSFTSPGQYTKLRVKAEMYGSDGKLMDSADITYDYTTFLNIEKRLKLTAPETASDIIDYSVEYTDKYSDPLKGDVAVYLSSSEDKVVSLNEGKISGKLSGQFPVVGFAEGPYTLKVVEKSNSISDAKNVDVVNPKAIQVTTTEEVATTQKEVTTTTIHPVTESSIPWGIIAVVVILIVLALVMLKSRKKEAKK